MNTKTNYGLWTTESTKANKNKNKSAKFNNNITQRIRRQGAGRRKKKGRDFYTHIERKQRSKTKTLQNKNIRQEVH
jgi:hypothetical protein